MGKADSLPVSIYTPDSQMRSPVRLLRAMLRDLRESRELAWRLFVRDLSAQYRQSLFGVLWGFVPAIVTSLIFIALQSRKVVNFGVTDIPYPVFVLVGAMLWQIFAEALNAPLRSVTAARSLLVRINFPREALIVSALYTVLFNLLFKVIVIAAVLVIFRVPPTWKLLLAPVPVLMLVVLGIGVGLLLTPIGMLYNDVATSLPVIVQILFFVTPVVYPPPNSFPFLLLAVVNPVSPLLMAGRDLITKGYMVHHTAFLGVSAISVLILLFAWVLYRVALPIIIERMSA